MSSGAQGFKVTGIDMSGYMVKDTDRALGFYRDVLGLEPTTVYPDGAGIEYELADGSTFGLFNGGERMPWRSGTGVMFAVDDFDAAVRNAKAHGATIAMEYESPVCFMAITEDTEGNQLVIHKRKNA
jgi:predicted enzyme related to lactoylglutathione lyase